MKIQILKSKIHRVKVTGADLNYIGSITIDEDLMDAANIIEGEKIQIVNNNNGERFDTYVIPGQRNSGEITVNGAAARKVQVDDVLILITYAFMSLKKAFISEIDIEESSPILLPLNCIDKDSFFRRIPLHVLHGLKLINCSIQLRMPGDLVCLYLRIKFGIAPSHPPV